MTVATTLETFGVTGLGEIYPVMLQEGCAAGGVYPQPDGSHTHPEGVVLIYCGAQPEAVLQLPHAPQLGGAVGDGGDVGPGGGAVGAGGLYVQLPVE